MDQLKVAFVIAVYAVVIVLEFNRDKQMAEAISLKLNEYRQKGK